MTPKEAAAMLDGREYPFRLTGEEARALKSWRLVVITGHSDDVPSLMGAIDDESGSMTFRITEEGISPEDADGGVLIRASYGEGGDGDPLWRFLTDAPHDTFRVMEEGEVFAEALVMSLDDVPARALLTFTEDGVARFVMDGKPLFGQVVRDAEGARLTREIAEGIAAAMCHRLTVAGVPPG